MVKYLINEQYDVEEAGASKGFGKGEKREDYADPWTDSGNVVLVGLPGSGKAELAALLSKRLECPVQTPNTAEEAVHALGGQKQIIVLSDNLVENAEVQPHIHGAGKVFYLLIDTNTLSRRLVSGDGDGEQERVWQELSERLVVMEPVFYSVLHFILQATQGPDELLGDALEKIAF